jgi:hypothetical protein
VTGGLDMLDLPSFPEFKFHLLDLNTEAIFRVTLYYYLEVIIHPCHAGVKNACNARIYLHGGVLRWGGEGQNYLYAYIALFHSTVSAYLRTTQHTLGKVEEEFRTVITTLFVQVFMSCIGKPQ